MKNFFFSLLLVTFVVTPVFAFAQPVINHGELNQPNAVTNYGQLNPVQTGDQNLINPLGEDATLEGFLESIIRLFIRIGTLVIITMIIYIGFLFVAAQGAPEKISNARNMLLWTLIGGLILLGAQAIAIGIQATVEDISGKPSTVQQPVNRLQ